MELCRASHSYATRENAVTALSKALTRLHLDLDAVRWVIVVTDVGRFVPVVMQSSVAPHNMLPLVNQHISVMG